jgi:hypothetical protein
MTALDQGQFYPLPTARVRRHRWLGQAAAKNLSRHVLEFAPLLHGTHFHGTQEIIGNIEGRFHIDKLPAFQLSVKLLLWGSFFGGSWQGDQAKIQPPLPASGFATWREHKRVKSAAI